MKIRLEKNSTTIALTGDPVLVGTHPRAEIRSDEKNLHRRHALFAHALSGWTAFDLRSRHGLFINDKKVLKHTLSHGDRIRVGPLQMIVDDADAETVNGDAANLDEDESWLDQVLSESEDQVSFSSRCRLDFFSGDKLFRSVLADSDALIGTSVRAHLRLPRRGVSSLHCLLAVDSGAWYLFDLQSDNGIVVDGKTVYWHSLHEGDEFHIGEFRVVFRLQPESSSVGDAEEWEDHEFLSESTPSSGSLTDAAFDAGVAALTVDAEPSNDSSDDAVPALDAKAAEAIRMFNSGQVDKALEFLRHVCAAAPYSLKYRQALRTAQYRAFERTPSAAKLTDRMALWFLKMACARALNRGDLPNALKIAEKGLTIDPWNHDLLVMEGLVFEKKQLLRHCVWVLSSARKKAPRDVRLNRTIAKIMQHLGEYDQAERYWKMVTKANPDDREADRQIRAVLVQRTLQRNRYQTSDSWENLLEG